MWEAGTNSFGAVVPPNARVPVKLTEYEARFWCWRSLAYIVVPLCEAASP